jgi:hypothetical protein
MKRPLDWNLCRKSCCVSVLSRKRACEPGPSLCRKNGLDLPIGHIKGYRLASKNPGTRAVFGRARPKTGLRVAVGSNLKFHSTTASSPTAHRHRPVELGAADRSKPNLTKWQNKMPTRVSFLCASARNVRRSAAAAPRCRGRYLAVGVVR